MPSDNKTKRNTRQVTRLDASFGRYDPDVVSRPVDTYVHTNPVDAGRNYQMLAASLGAFADPFNRFLQDKHKEQIVEDEAKGQRLYYETGGQRLSWVDAREAYDERLKEVGVNTSIRNGYLKARMANEANIFREEMYNAYHSGEATVTLSDGTVIPVSESDDPAVFNLWLNQFTAQYIRDNLGQDADPEYFAKIFVPQLEKNANEIQSIHIHERNRVLNDRIIGESNTAISNALSKLRTPDGGFMDAPEERREVLAEIQGLIHNMRVSGLSHSQINATLKDLLISMAYDPTLQEGEELLFMAQSITMENGHSLWDTENNALDFVRALQNVQQQRNYREIREKHEKDERGSQAVADALSYVYKNQSVPQEVQQTINTLYGPDMLMKLLHDADTVRRYNFPDTSTADEKLRQRMADDLINYVQTATARGETVNLAQFINTEAWKALTLSEREKLIEMVRGDKEAKPIIAQANKYLEDIAEEFLRAHSHEKNTTDYQRYFMTLTGHLRQLIHTAAHNPAVIANPEPFYQEITREAYHFMDSVWNQPGVLKAIADNNLLPTDIDTAVKVVATERLAELKRRYEAMQKANKPVDSLLYKHLLTRSEKSSGGKGDNPIKDMVDNAQVTGRFNDKREYRNGIHNGIDLAPQGKDRTNTPIKSPNLDIPLSVSRVVTNKPKTGGGNQVYLTGKLKDGRPVEIAISHLANNSIRVKQGDTVTPGQILAIVGNTGMTSEGKKVTPWREGKKTGYHADIKIKVDGKYVDPETFTFA